MIYLFSKYLSLKYHSIFLKKNTYLVILQSKKKKRIFCRYQVPTTNQFAKKKWIILLELRDNLTHKFFWKTTWIFWDIIINLCYE
jgi:hypothetical protein